ncbi:hypothetical protein FRB94_008871 [Tulasnella sp. JGI-2019a]|nr:hypothetical protein FRB93_004383 [Tulasnella sp. JGI-2019a]KAG8995675.1 hypothetical protein FRB94_008871 [Tulasnella sp. JGI-2019a]KAG9028154.1 hypothetical protein FRB95_006803 [Tulasnella sp. JGI-2019a]
MNSFIQTPTSASPFSLFASPSNTADMYGSLYNQLQTRRGSLPTTSLFASASSSSGSSSSSQPSTPLPRLAPMSDNVAPSGANSTTPSSWHARAKQSIMAFPRRKSVF